ncbi:vWA domain-containing protein [Streptosporangium saharense]|uniref:vWA domain-containing protein n=1 Tax=Streptosporangium saharense TaxID=1706840 RepID=UPI0036A0A686
MTVLALAAAVVWVILSLPGHRTAFLVDTSQSVPAKHFGAVRDAVGSVARNSAGGDALSLRRFGGACGDPANTAELVGSGTHQGERIAEAARPLTPGGQATLLSGILGAIDDFSGLYPFRGTRSNRVVVVTGSGADACTGDQEAVRRTIRERLAEAGLKIEFRFVGYRVPAKQRDTLTELAEVTGAPAPRFVKTAKDLTATLKELTVPKSPDAKPLEIPSEKPTGKKGKKWPFVVVLGTAWGVKVTGAPVACARRTGRGSEHCSFEMAEGEKITLEVEITGPDPMPARAENNPYYRPLKTPFWYGCDEGPKSRTCTVTMTRERVEVTGPDSPQTTLPTAGLVACVGTEDPYSTGLTTCAMLTGSAPPPMPKVTYADGSVGDG